MGCNESKHDIVTGNTVTKKQSPLHTNSDVINFAGTNSSSTEQQPSESNSKNADNKNSIKNGNDHDELLGVTDVKDITVNAELKNRDFGKVVQELDEHDEKGRLMISSPDHFFSSRKHEDAVAPIVAEEEEGVEFEYHSPVHEFVKYGTKSVQIHEEKEIVMEKKGLLTDEQEDQNAKSGELKKDKKQKVAEISLESSC